MTLAIMTLQDTILGPCLWNVFFVDVTQYVSLRIHLFVDDITAMCHHDVADDIICMNCVKFKLGHMNGASGIRYSSTSAKNT